MTFASGPGTQSLGVQWKSPFDLSVFSRATSSTFFMNTERFCWKVCITFEVFEAVGLVGTIIPLACGMWKARHFSFRVSPHSISPPRAPKIAHNTFGFWLQTLLKFGWSPNMVHTPHTQPIYTMYTKSCYYQFDNLTCPHYIYIIIYTCTCMIMYVSNYIIIQLNCYISIFHGYLVRWPRLRESFQDPQKYCRLVSINRH
jgi:hypothetical protein